MLVMKKRLNRDKKAISIIVSYVLLITLVLALAGGTYAFLKLYAQNPLPEEECPDGVSIVLEDYSCENGKIDITLRNRGRYDVTLVTLNIINESGRFFFMDFPQNRLDVTSDKFPVEGPALTKSKEYSGSIDSLEIIPLRRGKQLRDFVCTEAIVKVSVGCE